MGGSAGQFSTLTSSDFCPVQGGSPLFRPIPKESPPRSYILTLCSSSLSTRLPSGTASIISSIADSRVPTSLDSSKPATPPNCVQLQTPTPHITIKYKPSDMGIKPITDKASWTDVKKIIDARLRRAPYWPGESKQLITTEANAAASVWWEEVISFYCQPRFLTYLLRRVALMGKDLK